MAINYKKELEAASKNMIFVHEPDTLIRMIVRTIVQKAQVSHAGILLYDSGHDSYVLTISRGPTGLKIPAGFARMDKDNALIRFFREPRDYKLFSHGALIYDDSRKLLAKNIPTDVKNILRDALYQMEIFEAIACIPSYFRNDLLGILLLGHKKRRGERINREEVDFFAALASDVAMAIRNAQLFHELELELDKKHRLFIQTTFSLAAAIDAKDHYTHGHTARVTDLSLVIARRLSQKDKNAFDDKFMENLHIAGLLHDIGKIGIPEAILNKPASLTDEEKKRMNEHPTVGTTILEPIQELKEAILGVKYHHEKYDGSGYPEGLKGEHIPIIAAIIAVADSYDAMTTDRPYRRALSKQDAIAEIQRQSGKQFNPIPAAALVEIYQEGKI